MASIADRVKETSTTTGTGTLNLAGAVTGYQSLVAGIGTGNTCYYCIEHQTAAEWEVGIGTVTDASPDTLSRTTILASSNGGSLVSFSAGTKNVFVSYPAGRAVLLDVANTFTASQVALSESASISWEVDLYGSNVGQNIFKRARGTLASPTAVLNGDSLGALSFRGYDGTQFSGSKAYIAAIAAENWSGSATGTYLSFQTTPTGSTTLTEVMRLTNKNLGLNTSTFGTSASGVIGLLNAATVPGSSPANMIQVYAKDSSDGAANSTVAIRTEQGVETIGTFTASHKLKVWINEVEYWIQLDAVL